MRPVESLRKQLLGLDGKGYGAYQSIKGHYSYPNFDLYIDQIPKDPYAPPTSGVYRVRVPQKVSGFRADMAANRIRTIALGDYFVRQFAINCRKLSKGRRGTGHSGSIRIIEPSQIALNRTSAIIEKEFAELRFFIGMPAKGRRIMARTAEQMLYDELPEIVESSLLLENLNENEIYRHIETVEDTEHLRRQLDSLGLVGFIPDGALLPRASGIDERPLRDPSVVPFKSPDSLRVEIDLPNKGKISGMGVPKGITLIAGGGYHGKSTLLRTLELGVYSHIPDDGREYSASNPETVKVRASSGRYVEKTDISAYINNLPQKKKTESFSTLNASGSTSQAATIQEAIEAGAKVLLLDEDTCAANFMIRDKRMQELVRRADEPITSFIDNVRLLYEQLGISTILVMGGSGDYFDAADRVMQMIDFKPYDVTEQAKKVSVEFPTGRSFEGGESLERPKNRVPGAGSIDPENQYGKFKISASSPFDLQFGKQNIDLSDVEQLLETAQTKGIGRAINYAKKYMDGKRTIKQVIDMVMQDISEKGLDILDKRLIGDLAEFRGLEMAAALNRMRGFRGLDEE